MLKQVADNCSVGQTSSFKYRIIAITRTQSNTLFVYMSSSCKAKITLKIRSFELRYFELSFRYIEDSLFRISLSRIFNEVR